MKSIQIKWLVFFITLIVSKNLIAQEETIYEYTIECQDPNNPECICLAETSKLEFINLSGETPGYYTMRISIVSNWGNNPGYEVITENIDSDFFNWNEAEVVNDFYFYESFDLHFPNNTGATEETFTVSLAPPFCDLTITTEIPEYTPLCDLFQGSVSLVIGNYNCEEGTIIFDLNIVNTSNELSLDEAQLIENTQIQLITAEGNTFSVSGTLNDSFLMNECIINQGSSIHLTFCTDVYYQDRTRRCCHQQIIQLPSC